MKLIGLVFRGFNIKSIAFYLMLFLLFSSCNKDIESDPTELFIGKWMWIDKATGDPITEDLYIEYEWDSIYKEVYINTGEVDTFKYLVKNNLLYIGDWGSPLDLRYSYYHYTFLESNQKLLLESDELMEVTTFLYKRLN